MRNLALAVFLFLSCFSVHAGEAMPAWLKEQVSDRGILRQPGVYPLRDGKILGVGGGEVEESLRESRGIRLSLQRAERDATYRIAKHLYPDAFAKSKKVSVDVRGLVRVFESPAEPPDRNSYVAVVVDAEDVAVRPVPGNGVILDAKKIVVPESALFFLQDPLLQLGGGRIFSFENGWIVVAVGVAPLLGEDSVAEREAFKIARLEAGNALAETVFGNKFQTLEEEAESVSERNGLVAYQEWSRTTTREQVEGEFRRAAEIGYWYTDDGYVAVAMAVPDSPLDSFLAAMPSGGAGENVEIPEYPDWDVQPEWEFALLDNPRLLHGGAVVFPQDGHVYAIGVGAAKLTGNPANDQINAPRAAEMDARRNIVKYLLGFSTKGSVEAIEEITVIMDENGLESSATLESLQKMTNEKANGLIRNMRKVGAWKSEDRRLLYQVHVVSLE